MNPESPNPIRHGASDAEATLRLIAALPAPEGLEDRVRVALQATLESEIESGLRLRSLQPHEKGRVLAWRTPYSAGNSWMRAAAAAAIAAVVAGGGWGVYSRVQQPLPGRVTAAPARVAAPGGFGTVGAIRTPQTLNGPVLTHPAEAKKTVKKAAAEKAAAQKAPAHPAPELTPQAVPSEQK
jgi:hypothetical protein